MEPLVSLDEREYISGPVSLYYFQYAGRNFYFFGDVHEDRAFSCPHVGVNLNLYDISKKCFDIIYLLETIFERAKLRGFTLISLWSGSLRVVK